MAETFELNAETRSDKGKGASRRLRRTGVVPAILYGGGGEATALTLNHNELSLHLAHEAFYSHILTVKVDGKAEKAVLKAVQRHPAKPVILHIDLLRVSETEKIRMRVPLHFVGEDVAPGVKTAGGSVSHQRVDVEVFCLGKDLPEFIEVDLSAMELGDVLHLTDLKVPAGVELTELAHGADHDLPVVNIHAKRGGTDDDVGEAGEAGEAGETESE